MTIETNTGVRPKPGGPAAWLDGESGGPITAADCARAIEKFLGTEIVTVAAALGKVLGKLPPHERRRIMNLLQPAHAASPGDDPTIDGPDVTMRHQREEARLFKKFGHHVGAVDAAMRFGREWDELSAHGMTRMSRDRYVDLSMQRAGYV